MPNIFEEMSDHDPIREPQVVKWESTRKYLTPHPVPLTESRETAGWNSDDIGGFF